MKIALDHDRTYSRDPALWDAFVALAQARGHEVVCVTMRYETEAICMPCPVIYTSRQAKARFYPADIWIDDMPQTVMLGTH